jgi:protocatechuate 3,4-dioxygenase beta subunit
MYFPDDPLFFQDPILNSLRDESLRCELAAKGYQTLLARHSEETIVNAYLDLYQRLLAA